MTWEFVLAAAFTAAVLFSIAYVFIMPRLIDRRIASFQNDLIARHIEEVRNIYREMRGWRHDYHNHIQTMKAYRSMDQNDKLDDYLSRLDADRKCGQAHKVR